MTSPKAANVIITRNKNFRSILVIGGNPVQGTFVFDATTKQGMMQLHCEDGTFEVELGAEFVDGILDDIINVTTNDEDDTDDNNRKA